MNQRERVIEQIRHRSTDFIPVANLEFEGDVADRLDRFYGSNGWRDQLIRSDHIVRITGDMRYGIHTDTSTVRFTDIYGTTWRSDLRPLHLEDAPLENPTLEGYRFPEMRDVLEKDWRRRIDQEMTIEPRHPGEVGGDQTEAEQDHERNQHPDKRRAGPPSKSGDPTLACACGSALRHIQERPFESLTDAA